METAGVPAGIDADCTRVLKGRRILLLAGTRPEVIKLAPLYWCLHNATPAIARFGLAIQHDVDTLLAMANALEVTVPYVPLDEKQGTQHLGARIAALLDWHRNNPWDAVVVQGDTLTAMLGAVLARARGLYVIHLEAGLRTDDGFEPDPEEGFRRAITHLANLHLCPTAAARDAVRATAGVPRGSAVAIGNIGCDALSAVFGYKLPGCVAQPYWVPDMPRVLSWNNGRRRYRRYEPGCRAYQLLVTVHRRDAYAGNKLATLFQALAQMPHEVPLDIRVVTHVRSDKREAVAAAVAAAQGLNAGPHTWTVLPPQDYLPFLEQIMWADGIVTDSGGVQEEASMLGRAFCVFRDNTERPDTLRQQGCVVGTADLPEVLAAKLHRHLTYARPTATTIPYGRGGSAGRAVAAICNGLQRHFDSVTVAK